MHSSEDDKKQVHKPTLRRWVWRKNTRKLEDVLNFTTPRFDKTKVNKLTLPKRAWRKQTRKFETVLDLVNEVPK